MDNHTPLTIESIITRYASYIYNLSRKLSANPDKAEDLAQETFIKAWAHISEVKNEDAVKSWLRTICINEFRMMLRKEKRGAMGYAESMDELEHDGEFLVDPRPLPIDEIQAAEEVANLRDGCFLAMTRKLTLNQRMVFSLIDMFGISINETAQILDLTPKAVKGLLYRARMNLESFFSDHCSFMDIHNPCQCTAWIEFMKDRNTFQEKLRQKKEYLDYQEKGYVHDPETGRKMLYYYHHLPEQRPPQEWFEKIAALLYEPASS